VSTGDAERMPEEELEFLFKSFQQKWKKSGVKWGKVDIFYLF
jgi:hypothetical protein